MLLTLRTVTIRKFGNIEHTPFMGSVVCNWCEFLAPK